MAATINTQPSAPVAATLSITQPTCGTATGTITVTAPLGALEYRLDAGAYQGGTTFNNITTGAHTIWVRSTADNTCSSSVAATINAQPSAPAAATLSITQPTCATATGTITVTAPLGALEYRLDAGAYQAGTTFNNVTAGAHTIWVRSTADNTCSSSVAATINAQPSAPAAASFSITQPTCATATGTITVTAPLGALEYRLDAGSYQAGTTFNNVAIGAHTVWVRSTADNTCSSSVAATINAQPSAPAAATLSITQPTCATATGTITITAPLGALEYRLDAGAYQGGTTFNNVAAGAHTIWVRSTSDNTCTSSVAATINAQPSAPAAATLSITQPTCATATGTITITAPLGALEYRLDAGAYQGGTTFNNVAAGAHTIWVRSTADNTCTSSVAATINANPAAPAAPTTGTITQPTCAAATGSVVLSGLPAGDWTINPGAVSGNTASATVAGLPAGTYSFTVTNSAGCTSLPVIITINGQPVAPATATLNITQPTCTTSTGTITITSPSGASYEYRLDGGSYQSSVIFNNIAAGSHTVWVRSTSDNTCTSSVAATINSQPATPSAPVIGAITQPTCAVSTGSVSLSDLPAGNWTINPGAINGNTASASVSGLSAGTHNFTVTNSEGCVSELSGSVIITESISDLTASLVSKSEILCKGGGGTVTITATGGVPPYLYRNGTGSYQGSGTFNDLKSGNFTFMIVDSKQCTSTVSATLTEPSEIMMSYETEESSCFLTADGKATLSITGGTAPYSLLWSDGSKSESRGDLLTGNHNVIITDANGCSSAFEIVIKSGEDAGCIEVQEIMTPNNDGFYDTWKIKNIEMYPDAEVQVYNRWGEIVFSTKNISANEWDGRSKGKFLPTDSYHYILFLKKGQKPISGTITIVR